MTMMPRISFISAILTAVLALAPVPSFAAIDSTLAAAMEESGVVATDTNISEAAVDGIGGPAFVTPEAENPVEAAEDHADGGLPQLDVSTYPSQIFWLLVMFSVLYLTFSKSVLPGIGAVVHGRESMIKGNIDEASGLKEQAESIRIAYEKNVESAKAQAVQAVQEVELAAKNRAAERIEAFRKKSETELVAAEVRAKAAGNKAMGDMANVAAEVASLAAEKITGVGTDVQKARAIVDSISGKARAA